MKKLLLPLLCLVFVTSCKESESEKYPLDKPVWEISDYENVVREIIYNTNDGEKFPTISDNPELFQRITDKAALAKILDDQSLGLNYRQEFSEKLFNEWRSLIEAYSIKDKQDKFVYPMEVVKLRDWGYYIQIQYFKLGNEGIRKDAVNPDDLEVQQVIGDNKQIVVSNFVSGISFLTDEDALTNEALNEYGNVLKTNYTQLIETFGGANFIELKQTINDILKKVKSENIKSALNEIRTLIESKEAAKEADAVEN